jgi:hypothetical protein
MVIAKNPPVASKKVVAKKAVAKKVVPAKKVARKVAVVKIVGMKGNGLSPRTNFSLESLEDSQTQSATVTRKADMHLELAAKDTGNFDGFQVLFDDVRVAIVTNPGLRAWIVPPDVTRVSVLFGGNDGGTSAMLDNKGNDDQTKLAVIKDAVVHNYTLVNG